MTPRPHTQRFETLCAFLESLLKDPKAAKRTKMGAAMRLAALVEREQKAEEREARREDRACRDAVNREQLAFTARYRRTITR